MSESIVRPSLRFVYSHPAHFIAFGGGIGLIHFAPGTFGTLLAIPLFHVLQPRLDAWTFLAVIVALFWLGAWACAVTGRALGAADHGGMVWDEVVAFFLVLFFVPPGAYWQAFAFVVFRFFDIFKPPPIRYYDRTLKNGFGVMWDDLIAAAYTLLVLAALYAWLD
ncbi:MAG: phosphatidylglycerophosphatase A [Burkholderiales bacterium]|jgi:phosphatidylglycerophosphatase A|nr:phosphatidylglycerophosphatase A [Burkholderiales bacterium]